MQATNKYYTSSYENEQQIQKLMYNLADTNNIHTIKQIITQIRNIQSITAYNLGSKIGYSRGVQNALPVDEFSY